MKCGVCEAEFDCKDCLEPCERKDTADSCICPNCVKEADENPKLLDQLPDKPQDE